MASVYKRPGRKVWTAFYRDEAGKQHCRSTGSRTKKQAHRIAEEFERGAREKRTLRQLTRVLDQMHELVNGQKVTRLSLAELVSQWLAIKKLETSPSTLTFYRQSTDKLIGFLAERALSDSIATITKADLLAYRFDLARKLSPVTVNHHLDIVRMLMRSARRDGLIADDPSEFVESVKREAGVKRRAFTVAQLQAILSVCDPEWRSLVIFGLYTGQRLGDLARLTWSNLDLERNELRFTVSKTGKTLILPVAPPLRVHVESLPSADSLQAPLHPRAAAIRNTCTLSNQFGDLLAQAGLRTKKSHHGCTKQGRSGRRTLGELSFHSLRHCTVSMLHAAGLPQATVLAYVGHASAKINQLYTHVGADALERAARSLPSLSSTTAS